MSHMVRQLLLRQFQVYTLLDTKLKKKEILHIILVMPMQSFTNAQNAKHQSVTKHSDQIKKIGQNAKIQIAMLL